MTSTPSIATTPINLFESFADAVQAPSSPPVSDIAADLLDSSSQRSQYKPAHSAKASTNPRYLTSADQSLAGPEPLSLELQQGPLRAKLPPISTSNDYQIPHYSLIPRTRGPSAYIKRHAASHGLPVGGHSHSSTSNAAASTGASHVARLTALTAMQAEARSRATTRTLLDTLPQSQWSTSSVGDLEALDSILDRLVVLDNTMRTALLKGPLISFETVVPEPRQPQDQVLEHAHQEDHKDMTFLTSVKMVQEPGGEAAEDMNDADPADAPDPLPSAEARTPLEEDVAAVAAAAPSTPPLASAPLSMVAEALPGHVSWVSQQQGAVMSEEEELEALRATIPVPILPKLARMYITSKQTQQLKAPPPPPPTADYLLRSRPPQHIDAPSYDMLCQQIRDVQRQYTCGSNKDHLHDPGRPPKVANNLNMYISGLDGPLLDDLVMQQDLPIGLERCRPSFVALKKGRSKSGRTRSARSTLTERAEWQEHGQNHSAEQQQQQ